MSRSMIGLCAVALILAFAAGGCGGGAEAPYSGTWKVTLQTPNEDISLLLVEVAEKASGPKVELLSAGLKDLEGAKVEGSRGEGDDLKLTVTTDGSTTTFLAHPPRGESSPKTMPGYAERHGRREFVRWERSSETKLDPDKARTRVPAGIDLGVARRKRDPRERETALGEVADKHPDAVVGYHANLNLAGVMAANGAAEADVKGRADKAVAFAARHGDEMKADSLLAVAEQLVASGKVPGLALDFAREADKALGASAPAEARAAALKTLAAALRRAGKDDEAKEVAGRLAKLEEELDRKFLAEAIPFQPRALPVREGENKRVVLVELFTGAQCPPCVAADVAFDALLKAARPSEVVLLQYHLHIPGPDPMTNPDSEKRSEYYSVGGTPTFRVGGKAGPEIGGPRDLAEDAYGELLQSVKGRLDGDAGAKLKLTAGRDGDKVTINAEVSDLKKTGEDVRLRLALVEDVVRFAGRNGQRLHHHVVRAFPGGVEGMALKDSSAKREVTVNLSDVRKSLTDYLAGREFPEDARPMNLKGLKVVAFVQDDRGKEVLQAVQADVPEEK
jgi:hypothetical protein